MENAQHIVMRGKHDDYVFAEKNAEFLKTYDTDDKQIDYYTNLAMRVFDEFKIDGDYTVDGVRTNVQTWYNNKRGQIALLRNHPYWSEEAKAVIFLQTETRSVNLEMAGHLLGSMYNFVVRNSGRSFETALLGAIQKALFDMKSGDVPFVNQTIIDAIAEKCGGIDSLPKQIRNCLSCGCRITKLVRKAFEFMQTTSGEIINATTIKNGDNNFDKEYAKFSDCLSELTVEKITLLSVHFNDFMLMSNGNSWSSCHYINSNNIFHEGVANVHGEYKQGCMSYALDVPSMIFYTLPSTYDGDEYYRCPKLTRMCCQYESGVLVTGKCYPNNEDNLITRYRNILQQVLSQCGGFPNLWTFSKNTDKISTFVKTASGAAHYPDYTFSRQKPTVSICRNITFDLDNPMAIGHKAYCLFCSTEIDNDRKSWLQCKKHERKMVCKACGKRISEPYEYGGEIYCQDCMFWCTWHKEYEPISIKATNYHGDPVCNDAVFEKENVVHYDDIGLTVCKTKRYRVGDYVLMTKNVNNCTFGASPEMERYYPNRIVKITKINDSFRVSVLRGERTAPGWAWSSNCFAGIVIGATDAHIGKTIDEIRRELTHEA